MTKAHSFLGGSGVDRWATCTRSALLTKDMADAGSAYATAGTFCHTIAECLLLDQPIDELRADPLWTEELHGYAKEYADYVNAIPAVARYIEESFDLSVYVPEGFGSSDAVLIQDNGDRTYTLHVIDLKSGKGVPVRADKTWQLRYYALGALLKHELSWNIKQVKTHIVQPAALEGGISTEEISVEELTQWATGVLAPAAYAAYTGEGAVFAPSIKACRWCKAAPECRARLEAVKPPEEFKEIPLLSEQEILRELNRAEAVLAYYKRLQDWALESALNGRQFEGWKVVNGKSSRVFADDLEAAKTLLAAGFEPEQIYKPTELLGITKLTATVGKKRFEELCGPHLVKPAGKPTLVSADDERPVLNDPSAKFTAIE